MRVFKNEKVRLGLFDKLGKIKNKDPKKEMVNLFNNNLSIINKVLGAYFHFSPVSISDIKENKNNLLLETTDTYIDNNDQKFKLRLSMESYFSDSYDERNNSFIFALMKQNKNREDKFCYEKINDSVDDMNKSVKQVSEKALKRLKEYTESFIYESEKERTDVIVKVRNKWRIKGKKTLYWPAKYDTKADAEAALRAYWANKK